LSKKFPDTAGLCGAADSTGERKGGESGKVQRAGNIDILPRINYRVKDCMTIIHALFPAECAAGLILQDAGFKEVLLFLQVEYF
jgi:hypothetical protein